MIFFGHNKPPPKRDTLEKIVDGCLPKEQVEAQLTPEHITIQGTTTVFTPDENFLLSLKPETRQKLYGALYGMGMGMYFDYPSQGQH